jgi:hypothetical protein
MDSDTSRLIIELFAVVGLVMQPIVGALSDKCTSRWGRRRPFLVGGSVIVVINLAAIGWTRDIMDVLIGHADEAAVSYLHALLQSVNLFTYSPFASTNPLPPILFHPSSFTHAPSPILFHLSSFSINAEL